MRFIPAGEDSSCLRTYGVAKSMRLCEAANEVCRLQEELPLLIEEMTACLGLYKDLISRQRQLVAAIELAVAAAADAVDDSVMAQQ